MALRTRRDVWKLAKWDDALLWYAKGIREMQSRLIADPTSWRYQAAVHDYIRSEDPHASPSDKLPAKAEQKRYWAQCQHHSWFFLPWHRWYLFYFEQIVAATIVKLKGPKDWSLPYWNYSDTSNPHATELPQAFREAKLPDGSDNPLRVVDRNRGNAGENVGGPNDVNLKPSLREPQYAADPKGGSPGFGGPRTAFNHDQGSAVGSLETTPHGNMHVRVGGWMGAFDTAALDPIFWLHHANIDRLWVVWRHRDPQHVDPKDAKWLTMSFDFHDAAGAPVSRKVADVVDTAALGYQYEDVSDPLGAIVKAAAATRRLAVAEEAVPLPEMVGATEQTVHLTGRRTSASVALTAPTGPARKKAVAEDATPQRVFLNVENVTGAGAPNGYAVYLNVPENQDPREREDLFAGVLPMFGVAEASRKGEKHAGDGLHYSIEVTELVERLQAQNAWDPAHLRVDFVPDDEPEHKRKAGAALDERRFHVGRVSLYYS